MGHITLFIAICNYVFSINFVRQYVIYNVMVEQNNLDAVKCEVPSASFFVGFCSLFQIPLGSLICILYISSFMVKFIYACFFLCPLITTKFKKIYWRIPRDFAQYSNSFDFNCDDEKTETVEPAIEKKLLTTNNEYTNYSD
jgi:hypothetical protein